jgi:hypothetical protein
MLICSTKQLGPAFRLCSLGGKHGTWGKLRPRGSSVYARDAKGSTWISEEPRASVKESVSLPGWAEPDLPEWGLVEWHGPGHPGKTSWRSTWLSSANCVSCSRSHDLVSLQLSTVAGEGGRKYSTGAVNTPCPRGDTYHSLSCTQFHSLPDTHLSNPELLMP